MPSYNREPRATSVANGDLTTDGECDEDGLLTQQPLRNQESIDEVGSRLHAKLEVIVASFPITFRSPAEGLDFGEVFSYSTLGRRSG